MEGFAIFWLNNIAVETGLGGGQEVKHAGSLNEIEVIVLKSPETGRTVLDLLYSSGDGRWQTVLSEKLVIESGSQLSTFSFAKFLPVHLEPGYGLRLDGIECEGGERLVLRAGWRK